MSTAFLHPDNGFVFLVAVSAVAILVFVVSDEFMRRRMARVRRELDEQGLGRVVPVSSDWQWRSHLDPRDEL